MRLADIYMAIEQPSTSEKRESKTFQVAQKRTELLKVTDALGHPIDEGIFDTVLFLNLLAFDTDGSCEGHPDWGQYAPWISVVGTERQVEKSRQASVLLRTAQRLEKRAARDTTISTQEVSDAYRLAHKEYENIESAILWKKSKMIGLLNEFYQSHAANYDTQLFLKDTDTGTGAFRIQSHGAELQVTRTPEERALYLEEYQKEINSFTNFLEKYFFDR